MANRKYVSQFLYSFHAMPVWIDCSFTVSATDSAGKGITGLVGPGIRNVFMHTSATAASGSPNPAAGIIWLQLQDNYKRYYAAMVDFVSPLSGSDLAVTSGLTVGAVYTISVLGTTTSANWTTLGVRAGVTPAVGVSFIAAATGAGSGSGKVQISVAAGSGISHAELVQNPNLTLSLANSNQNGGGIMIWRCLAATASGTTTFVTTAPADGTIIRIKLLLSNSSVTIQGE